ncbi:hypothetical protein LINPERHAP1_LOCUS27205, partial [Linum perenne]
GSLICYGSSTFGGNPPLKENKTGKRNQFQTNKKAFNAEDQSMGKRRTRDFIQSEWRKGIRKTNEKRIKCKEKSTRRVMAVTYLGDQRERIHKKG